MIKKSDNKHLVGLARAAVAAALQRMLTPAGYPYTIKEVYKTFSYRGLKITSLFFSNVLHHLMDYDAIARRGHLYKLILSGDELHDFLSESGVVDRIVRASLDEYFKESTTITPPKEVPSTEERPPNTVPANTEEVPERHWTLLDFEKEIPGMGEYLEESRVRLRNATVNEEAASIVSDDRGETVVTIPVISSVDPSWKSVVTIRIVTAGDNRNVHAEWKHGRSRVPEKIRDRYMAWKDGHQVFLIRDPHGGKVLHQFRAQSVYEGLLQDEIEQMVTRLSDQVSSLAARLMNGEPRAVKDLTSGQVSPVPEPGLNVDVIQMNETVSPDSSLKEDPIPGSESGQMWMRALTPEQVLRVESAQKAVLTLMDGHTLSRRDVFNGAVTEEWQMNFCVKLESAGLLSRTGKRFQTRWTGIPERLEALSSIEQFIPLVLNPAEMAEYESRLYRLKSSLAFEERTDVVEEKSVDRDTVPAVSMDPRQRQPRLAGELELRVSALETAVVQQDKSLRMAADMIMTLIADNKRLSEIVGRLVGDGQ